MSRQMPSLTRKPAAAIWRILRSRCMAFVLGIGFAVTAFIMITLAAKPFSTPQYCGGTCHEMNSAYKTWELSAHHANNSGVAAECIDCHLPPEKNFFAHMTAKAAAGAKDIFKHHFGGKYDVEKMRTEVLTHMPNSRCLKCHSSLMVKPSSSAAAMAHREVLNPTAQDVLRCVDCHDELHERYRKIYSTQ